MPAIRDAVVALDVAVVAGAAVVADNARSLIGLGFHPEHITTPEIATPFWPGPDETGSSARSNSRNLPVMIGVRLMGDDAAQGRARSATRRAAAATAAFLILACCGRSGLAQATVPARQWAAEAIRALDLQPDLPRDHRAKDSRPVTR
jgi:hypothetical protein